MANACSHKKVICFSLEFVFFSTKFIMHTVLLGWRILASLTIAIVGLNNLLSWIFDILNAHLSLVDWLHAFFCVKQGTKYLARLFQTMNWTFSCTFHLFPSLQNDYTIINDLFNSVKSLLKNMAIQIIIVFDLSSSQTFILVLCENVWFLGWRKVYQYIQWFV